MEVRPEASSDFESALTSILGPIIDHAGLIAFAALPIAAGVALLKIGDQFEDSFHKIQQLTGATGTQLSGLEQSFKDVFSSTPGANFTNTAQAIGLVYEKTGLTGKGLDDLSAKFIELGKITGTDVTADIQQVTGVFGQFGVQAQAQSGQLDVLYKAARDAGESFSTFAGNLQTVTSTAQTLGLTLDQTAALTSNLDKLGLPASKTMLALGTAFSKAAKAGEDPTKVIQQLIEQIQKAPNATDATTEAIAKFGLSARSAATFVDSVRSGSFKFGATLADITNGKGGITDTAFATLSLGDKFNILKNAALTALEPIASKVLDFANVMLNHLGPAINTVRGWWDDLVGGFQNPDAKIGPGVSKVEAIFLTVGADLNKTVTEVKSLWGDLTSFISSHNLVGDAGKGFDAIRTAVSTAVSYIQSPFIPTVVRLWDSFSRSSQVTNIVKDLKGLWVDLQPVISWMVDHWKLLAGAIAILATGGPIGLVIAGFTFLYEKFKVVRDITTDVAHVLVDVLGAAFRIVGDVIGDSIKVIDGLVQIVTGLFTLNFSKVADGFKEIGGAILNAIGSVVSDIGGLLLQGLEAGFKFVVSKGPGIIEGLLKFMGGLGEKILGALGDLGKNLIGWVATGAKNLVTALPGAFGQVLGFFIGLPIRIASVLSGAASWLIDTGVSVLTGLLTGIVKKLPDIANWFLGLPAKLLGLLVKADVWLVTTGVSVIDGLWTGIKNHWTDVLGWLIGLPGKFTDAMKDAATWLLDVGYNVIQGLIKGMENGVKDIDNIVKNIAGGIASGFSKALHLGSPSKLTYQYGQWVSEGLAQGIAANAGLVQSAVEALGGGLFGGTGLKVNVAGLPKPGSANTPGGTVGDKQDKTNDLLTQLLQATKYPPQTGQAPGATWGTPTGQTQPAPPGIVNSQMRTLAATRQR